MPLKKTNRYALDFRHDGQFVRGYFREIVHRAGNHYEYVSNVSCELAITAVCVALPSRLGTTVNTGLGYDHWCRNAVSDPLWVVV